MDALTAIDRTKRLLLQWNIDIDLKSLPSGAIEGEIPVPNGKIPARLLLKGDSWRLELESDGTVHNVVQTLSPLLGGGDLLSHALPEALLGLADLALNQMVIDFDAEITVPQIVAYTLRAPTPWVLVEDALLLHQLESDVVVQDPLGLAKLRLEMRGALRVGGVDLPLKASIPQAPDQFEHPFAIKEWPFVLENPVDSVNLGALLDALGLQAVQTALDEVPGNLSQLGMPLNDLGISWDVEENSLRKVSANLVPNNAALVVRLQPLCTASFELVQLRVAYDIEVDSWSVVSDANLKLSGLPAILSDTFPDKLDGHLEVIQRADSDDYEVIASTDARKKLKGIQLGLRTLAMDISHLEMKWPDGKPRFSCDLDTETGNSAPALDGIPHLPLKDRLRFRVTLEPTDGDAPLLLTLLEWPFTVFDLPVHDGKLQVHMGEWLQSDIDLPALALANLAAQELSGVGVVAVRQAAVPLPFLHDLAAAVGLGKHVADRITLIEHGKPVPIELPPIPVEDECLPPGLRNYKKLVLLPDKFDYSLALTTNGGIDVAVAPQAAHADSTGAILGIAPPLLVTATQLQKWGWGEFYGFQTAKISASGDNFSPLLIELLAKLSCNGQGPLSSVLPSSHELKGYWQLGNARLLLGVAPFPIPIFFDPIELEYMGVEGLRVHLRWSHKEPESLFEAVALISTIADFLKDPNPPPLTADKLSAMPDLQFDPLLAITLPKYLGNNVELKFDATIDARKVLAALLNFLKRPSPAGAILAIPRAYRVGSKKPTLGPVTIDAGYAITSAGEWDDPDAVAEFAAKLKPEAVGVALAIFGSAAEFEYGERTSGAELKKLDRAEGIVVSKDSVLILLSGGFSLGDLAEASCTLGLALVGSGGFATAVALKCELLKGVLGLQLDAIIRVFHDKERLSLLAGGLAKFTLLGQDFLVAKVILTDESFGFSVVADLPSFLPIGGRLETRGFLNNEGIFEIAGKINAKIFGNSIGEASFSLGNSEPEFLTVKCTLLGQSVALSLDKEWRFIGKLSLGGDLQLRVGELKEPNTGIVVWPKIEMDVPLPANFEASVTIGQTEFALGLALSLNVAGMKLVLPEFTLRWSRLPDLKEILANIASQVEEYLVKRPLGLLAGGGILDPHTWVAFAYDLAQKWGGIFSENFKKLVDGAGKELLKLRNDALAGLARWDPTTFKMAIEWDPGKWAKLVELPSVTWDLADRFNWGVDAWELTSLLPADFWQIDQLAEEVSIEEFGALVQNMANKVGKKAEDILEAASKMFSASPEDAQKLADKAADTLKSLDPSNIKIKIPIKVKWSI
jgi:hypothetical protein